MAWSDSLLDDIRRRIGLVDVVGRRVKLERRGREYVGLCPFHNEKTPSFTVNEQKGFYHCFGCGAHGDMFGFLMDTQKVSFPQAVTLLAREAGVALPAWQTGESPKAEEKAGLYDILKATCLWFEEQLAHSQGEMARQYLARRNLKPETVKHFRIGFAPDRRTALHHALKEKGFSEALMIESGLVIQPSGGGAVYDRFRHRIMFPIEDSQGRVIAFGGRALGHHKAKYLNSPETPLFQKGKILYAWPQARPAIQKSGQGVVVEGYMDVVSLHQAGVVNALAPLGTALSEDQMRLLWKQVDEPILCFDGDSAGGRAAMRAAERALSLLKPGKSLRFALLPSGEDPDSLIAGYGVKAFEDCCRQALAMVDQIWHHLAGGTIPETPERWAAFKNRILQTVAMITDTRVRDEYQRAFLDRFWDLRRSGNHRQAISSSSQPGARPLGESQKSWQADDLWKVKILLGLLLEHPWLLEEVAEELGRLDIEDPDLNRLRQAMIDYLDQDCLDKDRFINHLAQRGCSASVRVLLKNDIRIHFKRGNATREDVRQLWKEGITAFFRHPALRSEMRSARNLWTDQPDDLAKDRRFWALKRQVMDEEKIAHEKAAHTVNEEIASELAIKRE